MTSGFIAPAELRQRWQRLNQWLQAHRSFWQPVPFTTPRPDWLEHYPELAEWLAGLSDDLCQSYGADMETLGRALVPWWPAMAEREGLLAWPQLADGDASLPEGQARDVPGRKRLQAGAFASAVLPLEAPVLDWCCGKGHLARTLSVHAPQPVAGFEWDEALVVDGNRLAVKAGRGVQLQCQDVMAGSLVLPGGIHGVALHACGELHRQLLRQGAAQGAVRLSISPCCYHLGHAGDYRPLSRQVTTAPDACQVSFSSLRLVVQETVTAPARVRGLRRQTEIWRLGFDALQRHLRACDDYLPVPSHPTALNHRGFADFCDWAARTKGLTIPPQWDPAHWLAAGEARQRQLRRHELVRHLFRRPLECWLVLDYALFLQEQGYQVRLGTFCDRRLTPRNLLLDAHR
ncbi:methyltransferase [Marinobacter mobilis]|uniref:methyltransferase n=1 Tax=Marinobacter mobilis TaxID=488533 RepID=UPI0035C7690A